MPSQTARTLLLLLSIGACCARAQTSSGQTVRADELRVAETQLPLSENAYNPIPSPDGRYTAYVATGWGRRHKSDVFAGSTGRSSLVSDVELTDPSGGILALPLCRGMFLMGWTEDSKAVICYRDGRYAVVTPHGVSVEAGEVPRAQTLPPCERVAFLTGVGAIWLDCDGAVNVLRTSTETLVRLEGMAPSFSGGPLIAPSRDGRYIAMIHTSDGELWVYDRLLRQWANLGAATVSPSGNWDYMQPSWDPWFADSMHVVFFSGTDLVISSPDGRSQRVLYKVEQFAGLAVAAPNGESVAYITFQDRPLPLRPDLKFWENTGVWVIPTTGGSVPRRITRANPNTTTGLRWLGNDALVFDRIGEDLIDMHATIWKVAIH
jgi:hypothetical protein